MKIVLDPQIYNEQSFGGISRYFTEVYTELESREEVEIQCPLLYTNNVHFAESKLYKGSYQDKNSIFIRYSKIFRPFLPRKLKRKNIEHTITLLSKQELDLFVPTYYNPYFLSALGNKPFVLTVYDMIHELFPQYFQTDKETVQHKKLLMEKATRIIAISKSTRNDILNIYPHIDEHKIDIVHLAHSVIEDVKIPKQLPDNYILFVGNRPNYKNFNFLLQAIAPLLLEVPDLKLLCAGGNAFTQEEVAYIDNLGLTNQILQQNFEDVELATYYKRALFFVFPSEYEGFGIPVLEAMANGCAVLLANHSSFPEVAGDAGVYFELNNKEDLCQKATSLLNNPTLRENYIQKGLVRAREFSWKKTVENCLTIYRKAI